MTRTRTFIVTAAVAFVIPLAAALAQSAPSMGRPASPEDVRSPMQEQAMVPNTAPITTLCGPDSPITKDEFGRMYNCRGDRVR